MWRPVWVPTNHLRAPLPGASTLAEVLPSGGARHLPRGVDVHLRVQVRDLLIEPATYEHLALGPFAQVGARSIGNITNNHPHFDNACPLAFLAAHALLLERDVHNLHLIGQM